MKKPSPKANPLAELKQIRLLVNKNMMLTKLKKIRALVNKALKKANKNRRQFEEPINWMDLGCSLSRHIIDDDGEESFEVTIEEASPGDCPCLCRFVRDQLSKAGYDVYVSTEW